MVREQRIYYELSTSCNTSLEIAIFEIKKILFWEAD